MDKKLGSAGKVSSAAPVKTRKRNTENSSPKPGAAAPADLQTVTEPKLTAAKIKTSQPAADLAHAAPAEDDIILAGDSPDDGDLPADDEDDAPDAPDAEDEVDEVEAPVVRKPAPAPISHSGVPAGPMRPMTPPRAMSKAEIFVDGDFVVYPTHGVGRVERIATEEIAGHTLELIHITFDENRMKLRVPTTKARTAGLRKLASKKQFDEVLATLKGRARIKRTMWSRRAQEYEAKINSGDPSAIAEVVRDLHRNAGQPDQSFSERQIYESALDRLAAEYGALEQMDKATAIERLIAHLKSE